MNRTALTGLGGCAILLCGIIFLEGLIFRWHPADRAGQVGMAAVVTAKTRSSSDSAAADSASQLAIILARPLFSPGRTAPDSPQTNTVSQIPRLAGIVVGPAGSFAVFAPSTGEPLMIGSGQSIGPYTVRSIGPNNVTISDKFGAHILHVAFANGSAEQSELVAPPVASPFAALLSAPGLPSWLNPGTPDNLPNAATWSGPPALSRLPVAQGHPASMPLLAPAPTP